MLMSYQLKLLMSDTGHKTVCQLAGLWELRRTALGDRPTKSVFYYSCIPSALQRQSTRGQLRLEAFTHLKYNVYGKHKTLRLITDKVDTIVSSEAVFPVSLNAADYTIQNRDVREHCNFFHVPFPFLFREGWGPGSVNLYQTFDDTVRQSPSSEQYLQASRAQRDAMYDRLLEAIRSNEEVEEETPDAAIIQGAIMQNR